MRFSDSEKIVRRVRSHLSWLRKLAKLGYIPNVNVCFIKVSRLSGWLYYSRFEPQGFCYFLPCVFVYVVSHVCLTLPRLILILFPSPHTSSLCFFDYFPYLYLSPIVHMFAETLSPHFVSCLSLLVFHVCTTCVKQNTLFCCFLYIRVWCRSVEAFTFSDKGTLLVNKKNRKTKKNLVFFCFPGFSHPDIDLSTSFPLVYYSNFFWSAFLVKTSTVI